MNIVKNIKSIICILIIALISTGSSFEDHSFYQDSSINEDSIKIRIIAIVPNRLPLNLTDQEKWRKFNWEIAAQAFRKNGIGVVDYQTSVKKFEICGLPFEDTEISKDKYAELCRQLEVDMIVIPHYGTCSSINPLLILSKMSWQVEVSYQFYWAEGDRFISRVDASATDEYISGILTTLSFPLYFASPYFGVTIFSIGLIADFMQTSSNDKHWRSAFRKAINDGLEPFFDTYLRSYGIRAFVLDIKPRKLLIDKGSIDGVRIGSYCNIYAAPTAIDSNYKGKGKIVDMDDFRAVIKIIKGEQFDKGDIVIINP